MKQAQTTATATMPGPLSWLTALLSVSLLGGGLYFGKLVGGGYRYAALQEALRNEIATSDHPELLLNDARFRPLFADRERQTSQAYRALSLLSGGDLEKALKLLESKDLATMGGRAELRDLILSVLESRKSAGSTSDAQDALVQKIRRNRALYRLLVREVSGILLGTQDAAKPGDAGAGAAPDDAAMTEQKEESMADLLTAPPYYSSGVLAGFPVLSDIPDGIPDMKALVVMLPPHVRSILTNISSKQQALMKRLDELKGRAAELRTESEEHVRKLAAIVNERDTLRKAEKQAEKELRARGRTVVKRMSLPTLDPKVESAYVVFRTLAAKADLKLPALEVAAAPPPTSPSRLQPAPKKRSRGPAHEESDEAS